MADSIVISGSGLFTPEENISNEELVESFNRFVALHNEANAAAIARGELEPLVESSNEFIIKASGIRHRKVLSRAGILDPGVMRPVFEPRGDDEPSVMCEMAVAAAGQALREARIDGPDIDLVIVAASNMERAYPAMAIELQAALGCGGYGYDMNVACSSATFGIIGAADAIRSGTARRALVVNPEICSGHLNFRDRDCHFIFGDVCTAVVVEKSADALERGLKDVYRIDGQKLATQYSNNIRNNFGFLRRESEDPADLLFRQEGRKVFKDVVPLVVALIRGLLEEQELESSGIRTYWLHQANMNMNQLIARKLLGREPSGLEAPCVLDEYANTSSAGSIIAFHLTKRRLGREDRGVLCSFGAGYSAGAVLVTKIS